jgi:recombination protein RecT
MTKPTNGTEKALEAVKNQKPIVSLQELIEKSVRELGKALPAHMRPERLGRIAITVLKSNPELAKCDPKSFLAALFQCASVGLEPILGQAYLIPYYSTKHQKHLVQLQIGYQGYLELFWRHKSAVRIHADVVYQDDVDRGLFRYDAGTGELHHTPDVFKADRGQAVGYYALATLQNGRNVVVTMSRSEVESFAKRFSQCFDERTGTFRPGTPWADAFDEMAKKTVLKRLCKLLPKSVEVMPEAVQRAIAYDETAKEDVAIVDDQVEMLAAPNEVDYTQKQTQEATPKGE